MRRWQAHGILFLALFAAGSTQQWSGNQVLQNVEKAFAPLNDLVADFEAEVNMERLRVPRMQGKLLFKKPDKLAIEARGFAIMPKEGIFLNPELLLQTYDAVIVGSDTIDGRPCVKIQLAAKSEKPRLRQLFLWVDMLRWWIVRMETVTAEERTMSISYEYRTVGTVPVPTHMVVDLRAQRVDLPDPLQEASPEFAPRADRMRRAVQQGTIVIAFSNHVVNAGIPDQQFERSPAHQAGQLKE